MSAAPRRAAQGSRISPAVVTVAAILLFMFIAWRGWAAFAPIQAGPLPPPPTAEINYLHQKAAECQGDFNKLAPADQAQVQKIAHGFGPAAMASGWRDSQKAKSQSP